MKTGRGVDADTVREAALALYQIPPDEFVAARDGRAKQLQAQGDRETAAAVAKLRRPTVGAWLVNLLVADAPDLPEQLVELADQLRDAQEQLAGDELRALGRQRHQLVSGLVSRARELASAQGHRVTAASLAEVESTLRAALADPDVAGRVLSGSLTHAVSVEGFGAVVPNAAASPPAPRTKALEPRRSGPPATVTPARHRTPAQQRADERRRAAELRKAEQELQKAERALHKAEQQLRAAEQDAAKAAEAVAAAEQRADWLRTQLHQAEAELAEAQTASETAAAELEAAAAISEEARSRVAGAQARADLL